ncbi:hypothetical protein ABPG74_019007 [Tetrahymena malaccensis]
MNSQPIQLPTKIHYHSRQNSPTNLTNFLGLSSKAEQFNTNNLYEYTDSNYNPLQDSPFINFSQLEPTPSSGQKSIMKVNSKILDPIYKGQQYELKLDQDKQISGTSQLQNTIKPNIFVTQEYLENDKFAVTKKEIDTSGFQIKSQQISPISVNQNQQLQHISNQYFNSANKNDKQKQQNQPDERRVLDFSDGGLNSTGKKITQIRSPALTQKTKPLLGFNQSNFKTPQTEQSEQKQYQGGSVEKNATPANQTFEDTPEIIKISKNILQPQFPASYSYSSLNNPASIKIKKPSPKNMQISHSNTLPNQQQQQQQNNESQISQFESINLNQALYNGMNNKIKKYSYETKNVNGSRYVSEKQSANFLQVESDHIDKQSQPSIQNSLQNISNSQNQSQSQQHSASSQKQQKYQQENKYSSLYKVKPSSNNFNSEYKSNEPVSNKEYNPNNFYQLKKAKDPNNNYYDSRPIIPSSDLNNLSDISEQVTKQTPSKIGGYYSSINQNLNQSDIKKMQEFPQKKRELLEQQRQLLQKEREILEREKELIEQEEEIFYETSQGQLTQMSPTRSSNNPLNMATTPKDKKLDLQNYISTQPYQSNFYIDDKNYSQQNQQESVKSSKKSQQTSQAFNGTDKIYEKTIRDSQNINSQYKLSFINNSSQAPEDQKQVPNKTEQTNKVFADKKTNPFYYTLNSLHASKNSQPNHQFQNNDQLHANYIAQEQNFQRKKSDLEQSFHTNMNAEEEKNVKDIIDYFKSDQEKTKKSSYNDKNEKQKNTNNSYSNKIIQLPLSMKKELSQKNKQPQITNQSPPEKTEETLILELLTPQKNNDLKDNITNNQNLPQPFQIDTNNPNAYLIKKQKIFSPNTQKNNRSLTPQTYFLSKNNQNIKISPNYHEFGIQVDENSFYDRASFINKNSPKGDINTKKTMTVSDIKSNPISTLDRGSIVQGQSNFSSPMMRFQYQNDASTNDFVDSNQPINLSSYIISNKQSIQKGEPSMNDRYRSVSQIQPQNNLQSSIEYVYGNKNVNKKQKSDLLCFGCGDTQTSTENNIIIQSDQIHNQINNQHDEQVQQKQTSQFHTFQTQPQEITYPLSKSYQPTQKNHLNKQMEDQYIPEQAIQSAQINFKTQEDLKANPPLMTQLTFNQDSIRSPYFRDEREEQVKRANISPQKIFYQRPNTSKSPIQYSVEKISYDPTDYKNSNNQSKDFHQSRVNTSFYPTQNQATNNIIANTNLINKPKAQAGKLDDGSLFFNSSNNNSFLSNIPKSVQQKNNEKLDFSYINSNSNTSGVFHLDSQELFCDKCLEFITQSRFQTHYNVCGEMSSFKFLDKKKQMELINQKILKIAYLIKRKNTCASPLKGKQQSQSPNQREFANPNFQQQLQQKENNDQIKLKNYCNYLNECLCDLSHKTITYQDFLQGQEDLQLIIQRIKSIKDNHNMSYYGEMASDILSIKNNLLMQNPI